MCFSLFFFNVPVFAYSDYYSFNIGSTVELFLPQVTLNNLLHKKVITVLSGSGFFYTYSTGTGSGIGVGFVSSDSFSVRLDNYDYRNNLISSSVITSALASGYNVQRIRSYIYYDTNVHYDAYSNPSALNNFNSNTEADNYYTSLISNNLNISYGYVAGTQYNTRINGSRDHVGQNIDRIVWLTDVDSKGNELPVDARVQIRAIPGMYTGSSKQDVLTKTYTDFILDNTNAVQLVDLVLDVGKYEIMWEEVANKLSIPFSSVQSIIQGSDYFYKMGWIYQIRLQVDDYFSDWQTVNTATSSGASESQTIVDSEEMSQNLIDVILTINTLNESVNTNWTINNYTISMDTYNEPSTGQKPWWAYLLEAILSVFDVDGDSQQVINNTNTLNVDFNDKLNEYNQIEDQQIQNLDDSLDQISTESDLINNNKFINSANWVTQQYNRITNNNPIGSLIGFSLLFGLALIFIGKIV